MFAVCIVYFPFFFLGELTEISLCFTESGRMEKSHLEVLTEVELLAKFVVDEEVAGAFARLGAPNQHPQDDRVPTRSHRQILTGAD